MSTIIPLLLINVGVRVSVIVILNVLASSLSYCIWIDILKTRLMYKIVILPTISYCSVFFFVSLFMSSFVSSSLVVSLPVSKCTTPVLSLFSLSFRLSFSCLLLLPCWILLPCKYWFYLFPSLPSWLSDSKDSCWKLSSTSSFIFSKTFGWHSSVL